MKRSRITLLFKLLILILFFVNIFLIIKFYNNYSFNKNKFDNYGTVLSVNHNINKTVILIKSNKNIIAYIKGNVDFKIGDRIKYNYKLKNVENKRIFNSFDYKKYLKSINVSGIVSFNKYKIVGYNSYYKLRNIFYSKIYNKKSKDYLYAFIMSDKSFIDNDVKESYSINGINHMLSVSGFHVIFLINIVFCILRKLRINGRYHIYIICIILFLYMYLSSFSVPLLRAFLLFFLNHLNKKFNLRLSKYLIFLFALNISLLGRAYLILNLSFLYTFILCFFLVLIDFKPVENFFDSLRISVYAFLISMPLSIYLNYSINLLSILLNCFLLVFVCYIIYPLCFAALLFSIIDSLLFKIIIIFERINIKVSNIKLFIVVFPKISIYFLIILYIFLFFIVYKRSLKFVILYLMIIIYLKFNIFLDPHNYVYFVDVNQGDMIVLISNYHRNVSIIDTGGLYKDFYLRKSIKSFLYSLGVTKINSLIITHGDYDHMGEAINLVNNFNVEEVIFNCGEYNDLEKKLIKVLDKKKIKYYSCIKELNIDKNKLYFLQTKEYDNENDNSNVIYTELNGYKFMFMGDAGIEKENDILEKYNLSDIDILKVGHHGSRTSSSKFFIEEINPKYSIISVGKNNRYGHPNKEALNNLKNSKIYRTNHDGSIMFKIKNNKLKIKTCEL